MVFQETGSVSSPQNVTYGMSGVYALSSSNSGDPTYIAIGHTRIVGIKVEHNWQNFIYQQGTDFIISTLYSRKQVQ